MELEILPRTTITPWRVSDSDVGDSSVSRRGRVFEEKDRPYVQSTSGLTSFSRNGLDEQKIHYVRRTRDVAGRNRKHQDRVKRKRNTMIEEKPIMKECLKHTKKAAHPESETKADDMMSTTSTRNARTG